MPMVRVFISVFLSARKQVRDMEKIVYSIMDILSYARLCSVNLGCNFMGKNKK